MKRFHIALAVADVAESVVDYSRRLAMEPVVVVPGEYALWRTDTLNFSIRPTRDRPGSLRHVGWEDAAAPGFARQQDVNGLTWEHFCPAAQAEEIRRLWPGAAAGLAESKRQGE
jgi:catechol 2,3-dioxygenase-like lactoylglutathione lyase family enzyme